MAKDPAFLFYPGDYLRDTQCLSEKSQVAYDRIMCEHMRNICITQEQLNFFIKRLSEDEKSEVLFLLVKVKGGYQIEWVAESICKRMSYSESRRKNKEGKTKNIYKTYDSHMENENVIEDENINKSENEKLLIPKMFSIFKRHLPNYPGSKEKDYKHLLSIATFILEQSGNVGTPTKFVNEITEAWEPICLVIKNDNFYAQKSLSTISNHIQEILQNSLHGKKSNGTAKITTDELKEAHARRYGNTG